jgi:hypothetical protein
MSVYCTRSGSPQKPTMIKLFLTHSSYASEQLLIRAEDSIEIVSAVIRAERTGDGRLTPRLFRLGIRAVGRLGFVTPATLKAVGLWGL